MQWNEGPTGRSGSISHTGAQSYAIANNLIQNPAGPVAPEQPNEPSSPGNPTGSNPVITPKTCPAGTTLNGAGYCVGEATGGTTGGSTTGGSTTQCASGDTFCDLTNLLGQLIAAGPQQQGGGGTSDSTQPTVVPTQSGGTPLVAEGVISLVIAVGVGWWYWSHHKKGAQHGAE